MKKAITKQHLDSAIIGMYIQGASIEAICFHQGVTGGYVERVVLDYLERIKK